MESPETVVVQKTAQKTRVGRSILLGLAVSAMSFLFVGFNAVMLIGGDEGGGDGVTLPIRITDVTSVTVTPMTYGSFQIDFVAGVALAPSTFLGRYTPPSVIAGSGFQDGVVVPAGLPTMLVLQGAWAPLNISVGTQYPETMTICIPAGSTTALNPRLALWVDVDGNTYTDYQLQHRYNTGDCRLAHTSAFSPRTIDSVVPATTFADMPSGNYGMNLRFVRNAVHDLGRYDMGLNRFVPNAGIVIPPAGDPSPLTIDLGYSTTEITVPAQTVTIGYNASAETAQFKTLCIPQTIVGGLTHASDKLYFFDKNGTPYHDATLTSPAISQSCSSLLAKGFIPGTIEAVSPLNAYTNIPVGTRMDFYRNRSNDPIGGNTSYGVFRVDTNTFTVNASGQRVVGSTAPLTLTVMHGGGGAQSNLPVNQLTVTYDTVTAGAKTLQLCVPQTTLGVNLPYTKTYFYDNRGLPYTDALLQARASCTVAAQGRTGKQQVAP